MLPSSLLALISGFLVPVIAASAPVCVPSTYGYEVPKVDYLFNIFCEELAKDNFATDREVYGLPIISMSFVSANTSNTCDLNNCLSSYGSLISTCKLSNDTVQGTGSIDAGCGVYNFTVWNMILNPVGSATTTIGGTTTLPTGTRTTTTSVSIGSTTGSSTSASSPSISSTSTSGAVIATESSISLLGKPNVGNITFSNSTLSSYGVSSTSTSSPSMTIGVSWTTGSTSSTTSVATTKPSAVLVNGAGVRKGSVYSLIAVAAVFGVFL